jgi:hypothetical protein
MMEIMAKNKNDNPLRRGWIERTRPNHYRITALGSAEADRLTLRSAPATTQRSSADVYDAVVRYADHRVFKAFSANSKEPRTWLEIEAFLGISKNDATHVRDRIRSAEAAVRAAIQWLDENGADVLRRTAGSGLTFRRQELKNLAVFISGLPEQFGVQFRALLGSDSGT